MSHWRSQLNNYHGSRALGHIAQTIGVQVDKLNFLAAAAVSLIIAYIFSYVLHAGRVPPALRKFLIIVVGSTSLSFCFGRDMFATIGEALIGYVLIRCTPIDVMPQITLVFSVGYLLTLHGIRQYRDPGGYTMDITGPLMMLTQRISALAFSIRDGSTTSTMNRHLTQQQRENAVAKMPDPLSYFAYAFDFHTVLAGPYIPFKVFVNIAEGGNYSQLVRRKVQHLQVVRKLCLVVFLSYVILKCGPLLSADDLLSEWYHGLSFARKLLYLVTFAALYRLQYYAAWKLSEAVCVASGYGFYVAETGEERSDGAENINIVEVETASSIKVLIDNWNISTQRWLKHVCHDRDISCKTVRTFLLSAVWHGLYPGYFISFFSVMYFVTASREVRRHVRPRVIARGAVMKGLYDATTCCFTTVFIAYGAVPFVFLELQKGLRFWGELYFFGHILALFPFLLRLFFKSRTLRHSSDFTHFKSS